MTPIARIDKRLDAIGRRLEQIRQRYEQLCKPLLDERTRLVLERKELRYGFSVGEEVRFEGRRGRVHSLLKGDKGVKLHLYDRDGKLRTSFRVVRPEHLDLIARVQAGRLAQAVHGQLEHIQLNGEPDATEEDAFEDLMADCGQTRDGQCTQAGTEYCDFECPWRDE